MARTKQQLINYHTSSKTNMPALSDVYFGEIVVRHNEEEPQLLIKVNSGGTEVLVPFIASAQVSTAIDAAVVRAEGELAQDIANLSGSVQTFSGAVEITYATSANTEAAIATAETAAKNYADSQDKALSGNIVNYISTAVTNNLTELKSAIDNNKGDIAGLKAFSGVVENTYATMAYADVESAAAVTTVVGASTDTKDADTVYGAKAYADDKAKTLSGDVVTYVNTVSGNIETALQNTTQDTSKLRTDVDTLSGSVVSMSADVKSYIDTELATVYTYKGTVASKDALPSGAETGDVYNVEAAEGTPGSADYVPAGTNYAWDGAKWDALGGTVDLSSYATNDALDYVSGAVESLQTEDATVKTALSAVSSTLFTVSASVVNDYATKTFAETAADNSAQSALTRANAYTDTQVKALSGNVVDYVDNINTGLTQEINTIKNDYAYSSITHTEIETAKSTVVGANGDAKTADTIYGAKAYADDAVTTAVNTLKGNASESGDTLGELEAAINAIASAATGDVDALTERVAKLEGSATTWNEKTATAIQGGKLGTVTETAAGNGVTIQSGAKMKEVAGGDITLDLSELIVDCGEF